ncbi:hypothetical protein AaE_005911 [Aphanomyces astaci]|uniref:Sister chromatid cohesion protein n=1 Tax=Aphanomyces astaci TaxID=112090 RepID=A0A6A5AH34_APHAT|nr:hypothetical protein AaE_005911 [Aphanomyces astaci]
MYLFVQLVEMVYDVYARYCNVPNSHVHFNDALRVKTVQGLGYLVQKNPRMLLKAQQDHTLQTMILHPDPKVRTQILASLTDLLQGEEARLEKLHATQGTKVGKDQVQGDQEGDASLIGGVMQAQLPNMLKVATQKEASIRTQAIACIGLLLTQGLIAPMQCIPTLVALETDQLASVRDTAYLHLVAIHSKFPNMVSGPAIQGIFSSYQFQTRAFGKAIVCDTDNVCYLGRMYRTCIQGNRSQRHAFFNGLLGAFRERGPVFTALAANRLTPAVALGYLTYVAQVLSAMPYDVEDEPLYVVYTINRDVALGLGAVQDKVKKYLGDDTTLDNLPEPDAPIKPEVAAVGPTAFALALLVRLKMALKAAYGLDNETCQTFQTSNTTKARMRYRTFRTRVYECVVVDVGQRNARIAHDGGPRLDFDPHERGRHNDGGGGWDRHVEWMDTTQAPRRGRGPGPGAIGFRLGTPTTDQEESQTTQARRPAQAKASE